MSNDNKNIKLSAEELFALLFDDGVYTQLLPATDSADAAIACGKVCGQNIYAFTQSKDLFCGAMSADKAHKLVKLYNMAVKTGYPVVGFYTESGAVVSEGNMLLDSLGDLLACSSRLSGVVPQISVVLGDCVGTTAMLASNADFVIMTETANLSLKADCKLNNLSKAAVVTKDANSAVEAVAKLITYLPANNLSAPAVAQAVAGAVFDEDSEFDLYKDSESAAEVLFARINGKAVGVVKTKGQAIDSKASKKIASFVRFCDAFSLPVITFVDAADFCCLGSANRVLCAYAEATTVKISVVEGTATGAVYMAMAGKAGRNDVTIGMDGAVISPIKPEAAAYIMLGDTLTGTVSEQNNRIAQFISQELTAVNAAKAGYIDDVADADTLRTELINYLDVFASKRESSLPKKHSTK